MKTRADRAPGARAAAVLVLSTVAAAGLAACGGASSSGPRAPGEVRGVEAAALPYRVLRARGGQEISLPAFLAELARSPAVCLGESHRNPHDHWAQLHMIDKLTAQNGKAGVTTALGMEMFQRPFQGVLDDFAARRIDEAALLSRSGWKDRWGFDWALYRPLVLMARERGAALLAINIPRELTKKVSRRGIDKMEPSDRRQLPELVLDDADHRAWWDAIMEGMGGGHGHSRSQDGEEEEEEDEEAPEKSPHKSPDRSSDKSSGVERSPHGGKDAEEDTEEADARAAAERIYAAQVLWDESMAESSSAWLLGKGAAAGSRRQIIILAGNGHCHESAIVRRIERRGVSGAVSVRPIIDDGEGGVAALLAAPENDYLFVMTPPGR
ncbi:MAG TPA: ChaN family lipoprotein [Kofleriaceae bacterium]|nr:ChaN family lipoprotein [Kofleriaceae bacterium]